MKLLNSDEIKSLLPKILKDWEESGYPKALAKTMEATIKKGHPPELAFSIAAEAAEKWLKEYLKAKHSASASYKDSKTALGPMMSAVVEETR
jgi:hypothetical protein